MDVEEEAADEEEDVHDAKAVRHAPHRGVWTHKRAVTALDAHVAEEEDNGANYANLDPIVARVLVRSEGEHEQGDEDGTQGGVRVRGVELVDKAGLASVPVAVRLQQDVRRRTPWRRRRHRSLGAIHDERAVAPSAR